MISTNTAGFLKHALHAAFSRSVSTAQRSGRDGAWFRVDHSELAHFEVRAVPSPRLGTTPFHHELRDTTIPGSPVQSSGNLGGLNVLANHFARQLRGGLVPTAGDAPGRPRS